MNAIMMKLAARNMIGLNPDHEADPDSDDIRREYERRKSPVKRAIKSYWAKGTIGGLLAPGVGNIAGLAHAHAQNTGATERTRHLSDEDLEKAHRHGSEFGKKKPLPKKK